MPNNEPFFWDCQVQAFGRKLLEKKTSAYRSRIFPNRDARTNETLGQGEDSWPLRKERRVVLPVVPWRWTRGSCLVRCNGSKRREIQAWVVIYRTALRGLVLEQPSRQISRCRSMIRMLLSASLRESSRIRNLFSTCLNSYLCSRVNIDSDV